MTVPLGHSKEDVRVFFEAIRPKIRAKLSSNLREFQRYKLMITLHIKLYKEKPDDTVDYAEPSRCIVSPSWPVRFTRPERDRKSINGIFRLNSGGYRKMDAKWFWLDRGSSRIYEYYRREISTLSGWLVRRTTKIYKRQKTRALT